MGRRMVPRPERLIDRLLQGIRVAAVARGPVRRPLDTGADQDPIIGWFFVPVEDLTNGPSPGGEPVTQFPRCAVLRHVQQPGQGDDEGFVAFGLEERQLLECFLGRVVGGDVEVLFELTGQVVEQGTAGP
ncbi:hypothetical protein THSYN_22880 [Candidatus Thiodictyon syntrophicum]|uniref:Uncharacterized protein n=1 Tax=Candidatus Thiodictyon syntrophicum TaxID=1166950 RepID=A0A2K8UEJ3_9GAMM|nr:hypothetical protein THSYN_22880 [Candidatus Thiodictyon syntrophicum]